MSKLFNFNYFGIECQLDSSSDLFYELATSKFKDFKDGVTHKFFRRSVLIKFSTDTFHPSPSLTKLSDRLSRSKDFLVLKHSYLTSTTFIKTNFEKEKIVGIDFYYKQSLIFTMANILSGNLLKKQLFQQLIKLYVEQTLLWYLVIENRLECFHSAAIERDGQVTLLAGLNGVGKSTLAQHLIANQRYKHYADNYCLVDRKFAYFSPDLIRLSEQSMRFLNLKAKGFFGFEKSIVSKRKDSSKLKKAPLRSIYLLSRSDNWKRINSDKKKLLSKLVRLQTLGGEEVRLAPVANFTQDDTTIHSTLSNYPSCNYFELKLGSLSSLTDSLI